MISIYPKKNNIASISRGFKKVKPKSFRHVADYVQNYSWSPCVWKNGHRRESNFLSAHLIGLDFDDTCREQGLDQAVNNVFCDMRHIIGTTKSHGLDKPGHGACDRYRVVLQFDRPITDVRTFRYQMYLAAKSWPMDSQTIDGARFYYPCKKIVSICDGELLEVKPVPDWFDKPLDTKKTILRYARQGVLAPSIIKLLDGMHEGYRNSNVYKAACDMRKVYGYSQNQILSEIYKSKGFSRYRDDPSFVRSIGPTVRSAINNVSRRLVDEQND